ncbi:MAG: non-homologous end-joining DNA ligase [Dichotomicrobium sp.]
MSALDVLDGEDRSRLAPADPPDWLSPMLATLTHEHFSDPGWIFERKLDGERVLAFCLTDGVRLLTRNRKSANDTYPEITAALKQQARRPCILDGEVVAFDGNVTSFSRLQRRMQYADSDKARRSGIAVYYYVFDIVYSDGYRLEDLPLRKRKSVLRAAADYDDPVRFTTHRNAEGEAFLAEACEKGWEGLIAKRADATYQHKRSKDWLKFKCTRGQELVIGGYTAPHGTRAHFGALLVGYYEDGNLRYAGKVGTGFDDETLERLHARFKELERDTSPFDEDVDEDDVTWLTPSLVGDFGFTEWTRHGKLRHPRFLGLRRDKQAREVVRENDGS